MKHPTSRALFEYWNECRGDRAAPTRAEIEPSAIRRLLGDTFVLEANGRYPFRIAGTRLCALFSRELKGESFLQLWQHSGTEELRDMMAVVTDEQVGMVASATGATTDDALLPVHLELLLLPLAHGTASEARMIGALTPLALPYWLGAKPIGPLTLGMFRHLSGPAQSVALPRFKAATGRLRHGLTVYQGGRAD
jgi:hypothetical protein